MEHNKFRVLCLMLLLSFDAASQIDTVIGKMIGDWNWVLSIDGWGSVTPSEAGYTKSLKMYQSSADSINGTLSYQLYKNDTLIKQGITTFDTSVTMIDSNIIDEQRIHPFYILRFYGDTIGFYVGAIDGYTHYYRKDSSLALYTITQAKEDQLIAVYPNPFHQSAMLWVKGEPNKIRRMTIFDETGRLVRTITTFKDRITLEREELGAGVYVLKVWSGEDFIGVRKLIIK